MVGGRILHSAVNLAVFLTISISAIESNNWYNEERQREVEMMDRIYRNYPWRPAKSEDSRSPCPMLNTLANHGILRRDGKNLSIEDFVEALRIGINIEPEFGRLLARENFSLLKLPVNDSTITIDLEDLDSAGETNHQASLTRGDYPDGDGLKLDTSYTLALLEDAANVSSRGINVISLARSRNRVEKFSLEKGGKPLTSVEKGLARAEAATIPLFFGKPDYWIDRSRGYREGKDEINDTLLERINVPLDTMIIWLTEERFPFEKGFRRSSRPVGRNDVKIFAKAIEQWQEVDRVSSIRR